MYYEKDYKDKLASMYPDVLMKYEVPFEGVRADVVLFTDPVTAFEIKSEKDNLLRLQNQVDKYFRVFTRVIVLAHESKISDVVRLLGDTPAGIWSMNDKREVKVCVEGKVSNERISLAAVYNMLRKPERDLVLRRYQGDLPGVDDFHYYRDRLERFLKLPKTEVLKDLETILKLRYVEQRLGLPWDGNTVAKILMQAMEENHD